jgi:hypothetical protein
MKQMISKMKCVYIPWLYSKSLSEKLGKRPGPSHSYHTSAEKTEAQRGKAIFPRLHNICWSLTQDPYTTTTTMVHSPDRWQH